MLQILLYVDSPTLFFPIVQYFNFQLAALLCKVAALRSFSLDKLEYWRERSSGISSLAYFLSKDTVDLFNTVIKPLVFLSMFYFLNTPRSTFADNYIILLCLVYCVTGIAYVFAIILEPGPAQLVRIKYASIIIILFLLFAFGDSNPFPWLQWCVLLPVVLTLIATMDPEARMAKVMANYCYPKWALEAFVIANAQRLVSQNFLFHYQLLENYFKKVKYYCILFCVLNS